MIRRRDIDSCTSISKFWQIISANSLLDRQVDIHRGRIVNMRRTLKPDVAPGEFMCRTCDVMWSNFMKENVPCTDNTLIRNGLHNFDFDNPILNK
jgi:hypothetical protein